MSEEMYFLRQEFPGKDLNETNVPLDPHGLFRIWLDEALVSDEPEPNAMNISSVSPDGKPHSRVVLLKKADESGFTFFTHYESGKAKQWEKNPAAAICIFWPSLYRQIRIEGHVEKISRKESEEYFNSRPLESRIAASISPQSKIIPSAEWLMEQFSAMAALENKEVSCPENWGGYRLIPIYFEFWQGKPYRLHDRLEFKLENTEWKISRLAP